MARKCLLKSGKQPPGFGEGANKSDAGETVFLFDTDANFNAVLDSVTYGAQTTDVSYGRPAANPTQFQPLSPTPGAENH